MTLNPQLDDNLVESIVAGVLGRLRGTTAPIAATAGGGRQPSEYDRQSSGGETRGAGTPRSPDPIVLNDRVVTGDLLEDKLNGATSVRFAPAAVLTPTARDYLRANRIDWGYAARSAKGKPSASGHWAAIVVRSTPAVERVLTDQFPGLRKELLGCPDDAASLAIGEIARGGLAKAVIFAEQVHRAACLANRHDSVKAVAVQSVNDVAAVRKQLRANVWCIDPTGRSDFELRHLLKAITTD